MGPVHDEGPPIEFEEQRVTDRGIRGGADQDRPDVGGAYLVWRDFRGDADAPLTDAGALGRVWSKNLTTRAESPVSPVLATDDPNPRVSGSGWAVWTDHTDADGSNPSNDDIYACKLPCTGDPLRVTSNAAHQMNPAIDGNMVVWEDYRNEATTGVDLFQTDLSRCDLVALTCDPAKEKAIVVAAGDQVSPSISGKAVAWRENPGAPPHEADVFVDLNVNDAKPAVLVADTGGNARSLSEYQVALSGTTVLWNEIQGAACSPDPEEFDPCGLPRVLKTCVVGTTGCTGTATEVDSLPDDDGVAIDNLDLSGSRGAWSKHLSSPHAYSRSPIASGPTVLVDDADERLGEFANAVRVDGSRFAWIQNGSGLGDGRDVFWRELTTQPRRANSTSLGGFGSHFSPAADGDLVVYGRVSDEEPGMDGVGGGSEVWATDLDPDGNPGTGDRRHFRLFTDLGTGLARPAIVGDRVVVRGCASGPGGGGCGPMFSTTVSGAEPGDASALADTGPPDADGSLAAWVCGDTEICVHDAGEAPGATAMRVYDVSDHLLDADPGTPEFSVLGFDVRVADVAGGRVVWHEYLFDTECEGFPGDCTDDSRRLHVLDVGAPTPVDTVVVDESSGVGGVTEYFDISYPNVVWSRGDGIVRADLSDTCTGPSDCPEQLVDVGEDVWLTSVSIDGSRLAWAAETLECCGGRDIFTMTIGESAFHQLANDGDSPWVDGDRVYWAGGPCCGSDVYVESATGAALPAPDTSPPDAVSDAAAAAFGGGVEMTWESPPDLDFFRVRILRSVGAVAPGLDDASNTAAVGTSATVVYEGSGTTFTDTDTVPGVTYSYSIFAFDFEPNFAPAATITVTA